MSSGRPEKQVKRDIFEYVSQREMLGSADQLLRRLKWPGENNIAPACALMYRNGDSSSEMISVIVTLLLLDLIVALSKAWKGEDVRLLVRSCSVFHQRTR